MQSLWSDRVVEDEETVNLHFDDESLSEELNEQQTSDSIFSHFLPLYLSRREALSSWLEEAVSGVEEPKVAEDAIFVNLSSRNVLEASRIARETGNFRLAILLSLALSRELQIPLDKQLEEWKQGELSDQMLRIYTLLAGRIFDSLASFWQSGYHWFTDWRRHFAMLLWYSRSNISFPGALEFEKLAEEYGNTNFRPPYATRAMVSTAFHDICFQLLKFYQTKDHSNFLQSVCTPLSHTANPLDYSLSWLLYTVLVSTEFNDVVWRNDLVMNFAFQLETLGLWPWAVYIITRCLDNESGLRRYAIQSLLNRHYPLFIATAKMLDSLWRDPKIFLSLPNPFVLSISRKIWRLWQIFRFVARL